MNAAKRQQQQQKKSPKRTSQPKHDYQERANNAQGTRRTSYALGKIATAVRQDQRASQKPGYQGRARVGNNGGSRGGRGGPGKNKAGRNNGVRHAAPVWSGTRQSCSVRNGRGGGTGPDDSQSSVTYKQGEAIIPARRYATQQAYNKAWKRTRDQPIARGTQWFGSAIHEIESVSRGTRNLRVGGRTYLGPVEFYHSTTEPDNTGIGARSSNGLFAVSPEALGGVFQLYADMFTQFKVTRMKFIYVPSVATTEEGQIAFYFVSDIARRFMTTGSEELIHASNSEYFVATSVYEECSLEIDPAKTMVKYFDDTNGTFYNKMQGLFVVEAATSLSPSGPDNEQFTYGNLFVELELVYTSPALDYDITQVITGSGYFATTDLTFSDRGTEVLAKSANYGNDMEMHITNNLALETELVYYATIYTVKTIASRTPMQWQTMIDNKPVEVFQGDNIFMRAVREPNLDDIVYIFFESLEAASTFVAISSLPVETPRQWIYAADIAPGSLTTAEFHFRYRSIGLITDGG